MYIYTSTYMYIHKYIVRARLDSHQYFIIKVIFIVIIIRYLTKGYVSKNLTTQKSLLRLIIL